MSSPASNGKHRAARGEGRTNKAPSSGGMAAIFTGQAAASKKTKPFSSRSNTHQNGQQSIGSNKNKQTKDDNANKNSNNNNRTLAVGSGSDIHRQQPIETVIAGDNGQQAIVGFSSGQTQFNQQPITPSSNQKTDPRVRLSSMFDGNQESSRSILRVNLIKKSNRQPNLLLSSEGRSGFARRSQQQVSSGTPTSTQTIETTTDFPKAIPTASYSESQIDVETSVVSNSVGSENNQPNRQQNKPELNRVINSSASISKPKQTSQYNEAKRSQRLIVSMIKDMSKTVSKKDLDEMLEGIHSAIYEVQQQNQTDTHGTTEQIEEKQTIIVSRNSSKASSNKKKSNKPVKKVHMIANINDAGNSSEAKDDQIYSYDDESSLDTELSNFGSIRENEDDPNSDKGESFDAMLDSNCLKEIKFNRHKIRRQLIELSSDEDSVNKDRKPNSSRMPVRCLRITSSHAKYISPHRKRSLEERLSRAQEAREKLLVDRANKFRDILKKVEEMKAWKEEDTLNLKVSVQTKLQRAAAKRQEQLDKIIRKAHDEDSKVSEIQFINNLEAQNRRHDMNSRKKEFEARLQDLQDERQRRLKEKAQAKEMAAEERRKTLEAERKAKLLEIQQRRTLKNQKVEQQQQVREKKRIEKNRDREQKIVAIKEAYNAGVQTLKKRIDQKQEQSERRHEVNLRLIRQKAFELSIKRYNSFINETKQQTASDISNYNHKQKEASNESRRLQLKPFNTKKFCNLCKETIPTELALFSHLRSDIHHSSINERYGNEMLTTNEFVELHNLRHIVDTGEPLDFDKCTNSDDQSSRASSLVNYYHSSHLSQANDGLSMSETDRRSLLAIEKKCRKLRHKLIVAGKPFNRDWFLNKLRHRLAEHMIKERVARKQAVNIDATSLANTIDLSANNVNCQNNKPFYLKITRIIRELVSVTTDQRISGGGLMPAGIIHSVDRLLADLNKQLNSRKVPHVSHNNLFVFYNTKSEIEDVDKLTMGIKLIEPYAVDTLYLYDIVSGLVSILRRIVPNVSLTSKLPTTVASHYSTLIDPMSLNSYYCHRSPVLPARIYIKMIGLIQTLCSNHSDICYMIFQSNNLINLSDILSYRLGFIIGNESPASSISGSSSAATLSAQTIDSSRKASSKQQQIHAKKQATNSANSGSSSRKGGGGGGRKFQTIGVDDCFRTGKNSPQSGGGKIATRISATNSNGHEMDEENDGEFWDQAETYKRTEEIVDDMTAALCKLLATVTETIIGEPLVLLSNIDKTAFEQRSDDFISYMVSVGIVDTESVIMSHIHQQQHHNLQQHTERQPQQHQQQQQQNLSSSNSNLVAADKSSSNDTFGAHGAQSTSASLPAAITTTTSMATATSNATANVVSGVLGATTVSAAAVAATQTQQTAPAGQTTSASAIQQQQSANASNLPTSTAAISTNNKIIKFTTSCVRFVTSLVKLVTVKLIALDEVGESRSAAMTQQDPTQLLATLKMTQLSGVLTLVYDMLVNSFDSLAQPPAQTYASHAAADPQAQESKLTLALYSLRLINYVAYIDINLLQETLAADEMLPMQLRHVCSYFINYLVESKFKLIELHEIGTTIDCENQLPDDNVYDPSDMLKNCLMNEIILLVGNFAQFNQENQLMLKSGRRPTIIEQLIGMPIDYFSRPKLKSVLMPTLICCAYENEQICSLVCRELSLTMLASFIDDQQLSNTETTLQARHNPYKYIMPPWMLREPLRGHYYALDNSELFSLKLITNRWQFERRFPKCKWLDAKAYFKSEQEKQSSQWRQETMMLRVAAN